MHKACESRDFIRLYTKHVISQIITSTIFDKAVMLDLALRFISIFSNPPQLSNSTRASLKISRFSPVNSLWRQLQTKALYIKELWDMFIICISSSTLSKLLKVTNYKKLCYLNQSLSAACAMRYGRIHFHNHALLLGVLRSRCILKMLRTRSHR